MVFENDVFEYRKRLYGLIAKEIEVHDVFSEDELKSRITYCCYALNDNIENEDERQRTSAIMADSFIKNFKLFLRSLNLLPENYDGDAVKLFDSPNGQNHIIFPLAWFWQISGRANVFSMTRLNAVNF